MGLLHISPVLADHLCHDTVEPYEHVGVGNPRADGIDQVSNATSAFRSPDEDCRYL